MCALFNGKTRIDQAPFFSFYPLIAPDRRLEDFEKIAIRDNVRPLILKENAMRLFGLA